MSENTSIIEQTQQNEENTDQSNNEDKNQDKNNRRNNNSTRDEITEDNCHFTEGEVLKFIRVRFPGHARSYPFLMGKRKLMYGQKVVAMSDRGMAVGYINSFPYELTFKKSMLPLKTINKVATEHDIEREQETYKRQKEIETTCQNLIEKHELDMNLTHVEFTQFGKKVVFYFVAPARVDFRGLVKDLVSQLKLRIELRQISVRDRAASMGALGPCGRELCCSSFLSRYGNVSIKMAKNQNLTLNYSKLNGVCGQLKCCLQYEDEVYENKRKSLPYEGSIIKTVTGDIGKVRKLHILTEQFDLLTTKGMIKRYTAEQFDKPLKNYTFKEDFDHISDETATVVGLTDLEAKKARDFERNLQKITKRSIQYAHDIYQELTGLTDDEMQTHPQQKLDALSDDEKLVDVDEYPLNQKVYAGNDAAHYPANTEAFEATTPEQENQEVKAQDKDGADKNSKKNSRHHNKKRNHNNRNRNRNNKRNRNKSKKPN
jgi:cell fate regulator YaaT (PSP1 superfamily)